MTATAPERLSLGIELGSTWIKACLIDAETAEVVATGASEWENAYVDGLWTYAIDDVWQGVAAAYEALDAQVRRVFGEPVRQLESIGVSAMMHGYLACDADGELLVPFHTWRNTNTGAAAERLTALFGQNIPLRWSIAHLYQAVLDEEEHLSRLEFCTTLAGYVHWRLTGERVLGIGDASGMLPIDDATRDFDAECVRAFDDLAGHALPKPLIELLPKALPAGQSAGRLSAEGAALLDPAGNLQPGAQLCPPEGDAGTGMVATAAVAPRTGNVSVGTSVFAMVVLEHGLSEVHHEIDLVTTPDGAPVAMVHCNNGASELATWVGVFREFAAAAGVEIPSDRAYAALYGAAQQGEADAGGVLAYNHLAGEPIAGLSEGRPLVVRMPGSAFTLANFMRAQLYGVFGTLSLGMRVLEAEGVRVDRMQAHGGVFRTESVAQQTLADALDAPVTVSATASGGGAWGAAVLAAYLGHAGECSLQEYLDGHVFAGVDMTTAHPRPEGAAGYRDYLARYETGLAAERAAVAALRDH